MPSWSASCCARRERRSRCTARSRSPRGSALLASSRSTASCSTSACPDASGLVALRRLREAAPHLAHLVLTGDRDEQRGIEAVAAGAQDYLVKGSIDGEGLRRAIRYAVERRQADSVRQQLRAAEILAEEDTRLERGLLPAPMLNDPALLVGTGYRPGRQRTLLGGDFYDARADARRRRARS